ncbi:cobalt transporter CbiM [Nocardiopsis salina]|uniref:cobalt transporter CbiM n=1 Tax=Nocardiopsis salina TaxID=245836 RepID=UPI00034765D0|nr:cobalt transporter CbiM [Nocardiopsis salina]
MHIPDGVLPAGVLVGGYAVTASALWYSLRRINAAEDPASQIPKASMFTAAFVVLTWIHLPVPPTSVHLILNGLLGVVLGWFAFPAIVVGLFLQAVLFGHGGLTVLGVNAAMMGVPALLAHGLFRLCRAGPLARVRPTVSTGLAGFLGGFAGLVAAAGILFALLVTSIPTHLDTAVERAAITGLVIAHVPLGVVEGAVTAVVVLFLLRVRPALLPGPARTQTQGERDHG